MRSVVVNGRCWCDWRQWYGPEVGCGVPLASEDSLVVTGDGDAGVIKHGCAAVVAQQPNGDQGVGERGKEVSLSCAERKGGEVEEACVGGSDVLFVWQQNLDAGLCGCSLQAWTVDLEEVARAAGVRNGR